MVHNFYTLVGMVVADGLAPVCCILVTLIICINPTKYSMCKVSAIMNVAVFGLPIFFHASTCLVLDMNMIRMIRTLGHVAPDYPLWCRILKYINLHGLPFLNIEMLQIICPVFDKGPYILHIQCYGCWRRNAAKGSPEIFRFQYKMV